MILRGPAHLINIWGDPEIAEDVEIGAYTEIGRGVRIGRGSVVAAMCFIPPGVVIGEHCFIGPRVTFTNDKLPRAHNREYKMKTTIVEDFAAIGAAAVILPGIRIGKAALVAAGSVVTKDVEPGTTAIGSPARTRHSKAWGQELTRFLTQQGEERVREQLLAWGFDPEVVNE